MVRTPKAAPPEKPARDFSAMGRKANENRRQKQIDDLLTKVEDLEYTNASLRDSVKAQERNRESLIAEKAQLSERVRQAESEAANLRVQLDGLRAMLSNAQMDRAQALGYIARIYDESQRVPAGPFGYKLEEENEQDAYRRGY